MFYERSDERTEYIRKLSREAQITKKIDLNYLRNCCWYLFNQDVTCSELLLRKGVWIGNVLYHLGILVYHHFVQNEKQSEAFLLSLKACVPYFLSNFLFFHQMIALQKLWQVFFISSKKLFSFSKYSNFYNFFSSSRFFPDTKG